MSKKKDFLKHVIKDNLSIKQTLLHLEKLDPNLLKFCVVKNNKSKIIGVLTDGDIRRILLKSNNLEEKISLYLRKKFIYSFTNTNFDQKKKYLSKKSINFLPILNKDMTLNNIIFPEDNKKIDNEVFIFAGGRGKRMFPLTENIPKPLLNVGQIPLIESVINNFEAQGFYNFTISLNYLSKKIEDYLKNKKQKINLKYVIENKKLGTAGPLSLLNLKNDKSIVCINGDIYTNLKFKSLLDFHEKNKNFCTVCTRDYNFNIPYGVINRGKEIINEKPEISKKISAGIYVFDKKALKLLTKNKYIDMNDFINSLYKRKKKIGLFHIYELVFDIGDVKTYEDVNMYLSKQ